MTPLTFHLIAHTHWDREWYLPRAAFQARLIPAVGDLLDSLEGDADARFLLDGQTIIVEDVLAIRHRWRKRLAAAVTRGQLEVGPWYILADEIVPTGESLVRNLLAGAADASALGARMDVLYSPDAFGHPAILPTLAAQFGITSGATWRGLASPDGADHDFYRWRGPDGAEVLLYHLPAAGYEIGAELAGDPGALPSRWRTVRGELVQRASTSHVGVFIGADHHAPPADAAAMRDAIHALEPRNTVRLSSLGDFLDAARPEAGTAPMLRGELCWSSGHTWTLQGTHATRSRLKRRHGAAELYLQRQVEPVTALSALHAHGDLHDALRATWRTLLQCEFHDTICGCCHDDVAHEQDTRLTSVAAASREIHRAAIHQLTAHSPDRARTHPDTVAPTLLLWNPAARPRRGIVTTEVTWFRSDILVGPPSGRTPRTGSGYQPFVLVDQDGASFPAQVLSITPGEERVDAAHHYPDQDKVDRVRIAFDSPEVGGLSLMAFTLRQDLSAPADRGQVVRGSSIANPFVEVHVTADGRIRLTDRRSGEQYHDVLDFVDEPDDGDSYTPWVREGAAAPPLPELISIAVLADGPLLGALEACFVIPAGSSGKVVARVILLLHADSPILRVRVEVDNRAANHRLRLKVPIGVGDVAMAGAAFGFERREPLTGDARQFPGEQQLPTAPAHRYVVAGAGDRGLALFCRGFFEYEWTRAHELFVTLLRSVGELSRNDLPTRPGHAGWPTPIPAAQELGLHAIELALAPMVASAREDPSQLERSWEDAFLAPQGTFIRNFVGNRQMLVKRGIELEGESLVFTALKPQEFGDGAVLRCFNTAPVAVTGRWRFQSSIAHAQLARADETVIATLTLADAHLIEFTAAPRSLVTMIVRLRP